MTKFRLYYDKDTETAWLQQLANQGWKLEGFFLGFYRFSPCKPGEYSYQVDLLDNWSGERQDYTEFMEEAKVKVVGQWWRWVYLEKRTEDGPFDLYTDTESIIEQYTRIKNFFTFALVLEIVCLTIEIMCFLSTGYSWAGAATLFIGFVMLLFLRMVWKCKWKIEDLKRNGR